MKSLLVLLPVIFLTNCNGKKDAEVMDMKGVYSLVKQTIKSDTKDSLVNKKQLKIYTDRYMMYASPNATDSLANYGIATYRVNDDGKVVENIFYTSGNGEKRDSAILKVSKTSKGYTQVIDDVNVNNAKAVSTEEYENVGKQVTTPLDGVWKQVTRMYINKKGDTLIDNVQTQFKLYQGGYFIWANTYEDTVSHKYPSAFGYGTFEMEGNNAATEINTNSTYAVSLISKPYKIEIEFPDKDSYKQTHVNASGEKSIEIYKRLEQQ